ncbi:MAG: MAPEG family protein [Pseudomonadota bacterium]
MSLTISTLYAAIMGLLFVPATFYVGIYRAKHNIALLDGGDPVLSRRIRAQGNFVETVPLAVILLVLMEYNGAGGLWLHTLGIILVVCRVMHYLTIATDPSNTLPRALGMFGTLGVYIVSGVWLLMTVL